MIFPSEEEWKIWDISVDAHKFFLLRWEDIFAENTYDSWQVRTSNVLTILFELQKAIPVVTKVHHYHLNIRCLLDELSKCSKNDYIIKDNFPFLQDNIAKLNKIYDVNIKVEEKYNPFEFVTLVNITIGNLRDYRKLLFEAIAEILTNPPPKFKIKLYDMILLLGTELLSYGYSVHCLKDSVELLKNKEFGCFTIRYHKLIEKFSGKRIDYKCRFFITWQQDPSTFPIFPDETIAFEAVRPEITDPKIGKFLEQDKSAVLVTTKVKALDAYSARYKSEEILASLFSITRLYRLTKNNGVRQDFALVEADNGDLALIPKDESWQGHKKDAANPQKDITELLALLEQLTEKDRKQVLASLQYHKLSIESNTDESRLVNLWIAVESLVQDGGKNIIDRITTYIPDSISTTYVEQTILGFIRSINHLWKTSNKEKINNFFKYSTDSHLDIKDLLLVLLDKEHSDLIKSFLDIINQNQLALFRVDSIYNNLLRSPEQLIDRLVSHRVNVEWQIRRIYRIRNIIMHRGNSPAGTKQLIQHLHNYYIAVLHNIISDLKKHNLDKYGKSDWGIHEVLEHRRILYANYLEALKDYETSPISFATIIDPTNVLYETHKQVAWHPERLSPKQD